ncbi:MAG: haloalkane dehalogenase [Candidatus Binatia bacterium]|nr:haloalkane dehalogenase [Candidatus Binatia bacterium]
MSLYRRSAVILCLALLTACGDGASTAPAPTPPETREGSNFVRVLDTELHFVQRGEGRPILFLHGNPTSSYLWRNVTPHLSPLGRTIALDLPGHGDSGKPDIDYRFPTQLAYVEEFIRVLGLEDLVLVIHDWGSGLGFAYASRHPENVQGIAFMEGMIRPFESLADVSPLFAPSLEQFRDPVISRDLLITQNLFIEQILATSVLSGLSEEDLNVYRKPFLDPASRKPIWRWPNEIPIAGEPADNHEIFETYAAYLRTDAVPKLWLYGTPGVLLPESKGSEIVGVMPNVTAVGVGPGLHYLQEDQPEAIGVAIAEWLGANGLAD